MRKRQRLVFILFMLICVATAAGLSGYALRDNLSLFMSPRDVIAAQQINDGAVATGKVFRLGGFVKLGSISPRGDDLSVTFVITDHQADVAVSYKGVLPDLFREEQGVIVTGAFDTRGVFQAVELLAKHDENYMPPELSRDLDNSGLTPAEIEKLRQQGNQ